MDYQDREKVDYMCNQLLQHINMERLWPRLLENRIFNRDDINIPNWQKALSNEHTVYDICCTIKTRGPHAFKNLILSLRQSGHENIVQELENYRSSASSSSSSSHKSVQTNHEEQSSEASNTSEEASNNCTATPCSSPEPSCSSLDEHSKDDYHTKLIKHFEPLTIKVRKAVKFKDGPEIKHIERYVMRSEPRGLVLIITNISYELVPSRPSAKYDEDNLKQLFDDMGFKTIVRRNLTGQEIKKEVKEFSKMKELRRVDSAFIIISSHGNGKHGKQETEIKGTDYLLPDYQSVFCTDIIDYFTAEQCPNLRGKPKIFIFQTCSNINNTNTQRRFSVGQINFNSNNLSTFSSDSIRGEMHQKAISRSLTDSATGDFTDSEQPYNLSSRNYEDTLIAYATLPGYVSYRDTFNGSWFIQILCEVFMNYACERHIQDLFVMTDRRLKDLRTANNECQTLWVVNQGFHKHCYLNPGLFHKHGGTDT